MDDQKTLYTFTDLYGDTSTLTLDKYLAESLHRQIGDVHQWIQETYDLFITRATNVSRRAVGDAIRQRAMRVFMAEEISDF